MEFMSISGCIAISTVCQPSYLYSEVLEKLDQLSFKNKETAVLYKQHGCYLWLYGDGYVDLEEGNRVIEIIRRLEHVCDSSIVINVQRVLWELNIALSNLNDASHINVDYGQALAS